MLVKDVVFYCKSYYDKIDSMLFNNNWVLVGLPLVSKPIGFEWILE